MLETVLSETPIKVFDLRAARIFGRIKNLLKKKGVNCVTCLIRKGAVP